MSDNSSYQSKNDEIMDTFNEVRRLEVFIAATIFKDQAQCRRYVVDELGKIQFNIRKRFHIVRVDERENPKDE